VRDTPAAGIIGLLLRGRRKRITAFDPMAMESYRRLHHHPIHFASSLENLVAQSDVLVLLTAWPEFKRNSKLFDGKLVFDGRYCL
jgi:UDP-glucose 6-dehydrogenase